MQCWQVSAPWKVWVLSTRLWALLLGGHRARVAKGSYLGAGRLWVFSDGAGSQKPT